LIQAPKTAGLVTIPYVVPGRHDGLAPGDEGLRFDRLAFRLTPGLGATKATRIGWDARYVGATTLRVTLRQGGAWRTEKLVDDVANTGLPQIRSYTATYLREGADLRLTITVRKAAPIRIHDLPEDEVLTLDVLDDARNG